MGKLGNWFFLGLVLCLVTGVVAADDHNETVHDLDLNVAPGQVNDTVDLGQEGVYDKITLNVESNFNTSFETKITGNISDYFNLTDLQEDGDHYAANLSYEIPVNAEPGNYTGEAVFTEENTSNSTSTRLRFELVDSISPSINDIETQDIEATHSTTIFANVTDNLEVETVAGEIYEFRERQQGNRTVEDQRPLQEESFTFNQTDDPAIWKLEFNGSEIPGDYRIELTSEDQTGNTVNHTQEFEITWLDAVKVLDDNFRFDPIRVGDEDSYTVLENTEGTPITFELDRFNYTGNSRLKIGVLGPDDESPRTLGKVGDTREFDEEGEYRIVVAPREDEPVSDIYDFDAEIKLETEDYHVDLDPIIFHGEIDSQDYPKEMAYRYREFDSYIGYEDIVDRFEETYGRIGEEDQDYAYKLSRVPLEQCANEKWGECTGFTMGLYDQDLEAKQAAEKTVSKWKTRFFRLSGTVLVSILVLLRLRSMDEQLLMIPFE